MRALYRYGSDLPVGPKCPLPFYKIIFPTTTDLYYAYKHDNQARGGFGLVCATGMYLPLAKWFFPNFKQEFLLNGKRVKCLRRSFGPARRLTLPLQKGDWTRWATLLAEQTFCNLNGSPCFVKKCVKRCLFQESSGRRVTLLLETNFLHINGAYILVLYINFHSPADAHFFFLFFVLQCGKLKLKKYSGTSLMRPALGHKIQVVIARWSHHNKMTRRFSRLGGKTMGGELRQEVVV